jgi:hypothetical protein
MPCLQPLDKLEQRPSEIRAVEYRLEVLGIEKACATTRNTHAAYTRSTSYVYCCHPEGHPEVAVSVDRVLLARTARDKLDQRVQSGDRESSCVNLCAKWRATIVVYNLDDTDIQ